MVYVMVCAKPQTILNIVFGTSYLELHKAIYILLLIHILSSKYVKCSIMSKPPIRPLLAKKPDD